MKLLIVFLAVFVVIEACQHGWSPDDAALADDCDHFRLDCFGNHQCDQGEQCCYQVDGCHSKCVHPDADQGRQGP